MNGILVMVIFPMKEIRIHIFTATGTYEVTLTVNSHGGHSDIASLTLNVMIPTLLEIEVGNGRQMETVMWFLMQA